MIYLDSAATTRIHPDVLEQMMPYLKYNFGNAGSIHKLGRISRDAIDKAREQVASLIGSDSNQIIFTSGGTEGNNLVFQGTAERLRQAGKTHIIVSSVEHDSVLRAAERLIKEGFHVTKLPVDSGGVVRLVDLEAAILPDTGLVSVMAVNNETGAVNPISEIGKFCVKHGILFHTDCVQAAGTLRLDVNTIECDFLTLSSHKIHGPKGVGALYVRSKESLAPQILGGGAQEYGLRGGTENVAGIVGFGAACVLTDFGVLQQSAVTNMKKVFFTELTSKVHGVSLNGPPISTPGRILSIQIDGIDADTILLMMEFDNVYMSAGAACRNHESEPSHVLTAMGLTRDQARSTIRISFSEDNCMEDAVRAAVILAKNIALLRSGLGIQKEAQNG